MSKLHIIFEGQDRVGKDTQIALLKKDLYPDYMFQTLHFSKVPFDDHEMNIQYSNELYSGMFGLMEFSPYDNHYIANRSHIGEMVYGPLYRGYSGDYVLDIEKEWRLDLPKWDKLVLITLVNDADHILPREDGSSLSKLDATKINKEKESFVNAHEKSIIQNKFLMKCGSTNINVIHERIMHFMDSVI